MKETNESLPVQHGTDVETLTNGETMVSLNRSFFKSSADEERAGATARYLYAAECKRDVVAKIYLQFSFCMKINSNSDYVSTAERFSQKALKQDDAYVQMCLGFMHYFGNGVSQNYAEAVKYFQKAAERNDELSLICWGYMLSKGIGVKEDKDKAVTLYRKAAKCGRVRVKALLGDIFYFGIGVRKDYDYACKLYSDAANEGDVLAMFGLGNIFRDNGNTDKNPYYNYAAEWGYGPALVEMGNLHSKWVFESDNRAMAEQCYRRAENWYRKNAEHGNLNCQHILADMYFSGKGIKENKKEALQLYKNAANHGWIPSQHMLGCIYNAEKDIAKACEWFKKAADQGYSDAQYMLGLISQDQNHIPEAKSWFQKAADAGHSLAKFKLCAIAMREHNESTKQIKKLYGLGY